MNSLLPKATFIYPYREGSILESTVAISWFEANSLSVLERPGAYSAVSKSWKPRLRITFSSVEKFDESFGFLALFIDSTDSPTPGFGIDRSYGGGVSGFSLNVMMTNNAITVDVHERTISMVRI